jgi:hypothetical protein
MADNEVKVRISSDPSGAITGIDKVKSSMTGLESHTGSILSKIKSHWFGFTAAAAAAYAAVIPSIQAYMEAETAVMKLGLAMKNQGDYSRAALSDLVAYSEQMQRTTAVEDDMAKSIMGTLKSFGMTNQEVKRATMAAADMASFTGKSIETVSELLGKAYAGNTAALGRYGIVIDDQIPKAEKFSAVLMQLEQRFGGAAQAELLTYAGQWKHLKNQWQDVQEFLGLVFLKTIQALQVTAGLLAVTFMSSGERILHVLDLLWTPVKGLLMLVGLVADAVGAKGLSTAMDLAANSISDARARILEAKDATLGWTSKQYDLLIATDKVGSALDKMGKSGKRTVYPDADRPAAKAAKITGTKETSGFDAEGYSRGIEKYQRIMAEANEYILNDHARVMAQIVENERRRYREVEQLMDAGVITFEEAQNAWDAISKASGKEVLNALQQQMADRADYYSQIEGYEEDFRKNKLSWINEEQKRLADLYKDDVAAAKWAAQEKGKLEYDLFKKKTDYISEGFGQLGSAFSDIGKLYKEGSEDAKRWEDAAKAMEIAQRAVVVVQAVGAIATQGMGDPYTAFVRIAAMAAAMGALLATIGESVNGSAAAAPPASSRSTVLGAEAGTGSESIANSLEILKDTYDLENVKLTNIYNEIRNLNDNTTGLVTSIVRTGGISTDTMGIMTGDSITGISGIISTFNSAISDLLNYSLDPMKQINSYLFGNYDILGKLEDALFGFANSAVNWLSNGLFGGDTETSIAGGGIAFGANKISDILSGQLKAQQYALIKTVTSGGWFEGDDTSVSYQYAALNSSVTRMLTLVYKGLGSTLVTLSEELGTDVNKALNYAFKAENLNLQGMTSEEMNKALQEYISNISDTAVEAIFGDAISQYQQLNEGLMETAVRLISDKETIARILELTNQTFSGTTSEFIKFSESLIKVAGGLDKLTDAYSTYYDAFFSDAEKQADYKKTLTNVLASYGYSLPTTREGYRDIVETPGISQQAYYALMAISGTADKYYDYLEEAKSSINAADYATSIEYQRALAGLPHYADGGYTPGGWAIVGEQGPEPVFFDSAARVVSNKDSKSLIDVDALIAELRATRDEIRRGNVVNATYSQKTANKFDKWDRNGLPPERTT